MPHPPLRIGEILVEQGVITQQQALEITQAQQRHHQPFGVLAEKMFDVTVGSIEEAWIEQYHRVTGTLDLHEQKFDEDALRTIHRRQAWQFEMLPVRFETSGELLVAASRSRLARAVTFANRQIAYPVYFRIAESAPLRAFLRTHFPMPEVSEQIITLAKNLTGRGDEQDRHGHAA